jgi:hypothetical protein
VEKPQELIESEKKRVDTERENLLKQQNKLEEEIIMINELTKYSYRGVVSRGVFYKGVVVYSGGR